jgi:multimeric flavodoxin WrbA
VGFAKKVLRFPGVFMKIIGLSACDKLEYSSNKILEFFLIRTGVPFESMTLEGAIEYPDEGQLVNCFGCEVDKVTLGEVLDKVARADAIVVSTPVHYTRQGKERWAFWEKLFEQNVEWKSMLQGKPFVILAIGGYEPEKAFEDAKSFISSFGLDFFGGVVDKGLSDCKTLCTPEFCYVARVVHEYGTDSEISLDIGSRIDYEHKDIPDKCPNRVHTTPKIEALAKELGQALGGNATGI